MSATVIAIIRVAPQALELPGLRRINNQLEEQLVISREAGEALERSNRDLEAFTSVVSHDLKTRFRERCLWQSWQRSRAMRVTQSKLRPN